MSKKTIFGLIMAIMLVGMCSAADDKFFSNYYTIQSKYNESINIDLSNNIIRLLERNNLDNQIFLLVPTEDVSKDGAIAPSYYIISKDNSQLVGMSIGIDAARNRNKKYKEIIGDKEIIGEILIRTLPGVYVLNKLNDYIFKDELQDNKLLQINNHKWKIKKLYGDDEGFYAIFASYPGNDKVIEVYVPPGDSNQNYLRIGDWIKTDKQKWKIEPVEVAPITALAQPEIGQGEINKDRPRLTGLYDDIPYETTPRIVSERYIPCIYVNDPYLDQDKAKTNPWYRLRFSQMWRRVNEKPFYFDGISYLETIKEDSYIVGVSENELEAFHQIVDKTASADIELKINEYMGAEIEGSIGTQEIQSKSQTNEKYSRKVYFNKTIIKYTPGKEKLAYLYQMIDRYTVLDNDGDPVRKPIDIKTPIVCEVPFTNDLLIS
jgi:hypothetical protein